MNSYLNKVLSYTNMKNGKVKNSKIPNTLYFLGRRWVLIKFIFIKGY